MKKRLLSLLPIAALLAMTAVSCCSSHKMACCSKGDEVTIVGNASCGKCVLNLTSECQNVIQVENEGKTTSYFVVKNDVSNKFHSNVCNATKKTKATGTVEKVNDKLEFTATSITLAE